MKTGKIVLLIIIVLLTTTLGFTYARADKGTYKVGDLILVGDEGFKAEMAALGYVEGQNLTTITLSFENYNPDTWQDDYAKQVQAMLDAKVDIFVVNTDTDAVNLKALVGDIPIVFARSDDPVATGAVASLVSPGGTATGIITNRPHERRVQILSEIKPDTKKIYYLYSTQTGEAETVLQQVKNVATTLGIEVVPAPITDPASMLAAIQNTPEDTDWLFMTPYVYLDEPSMAAILEVSTSYGAGISGFYFAPLQGYVMGYGASLDGTGAQAADIVDRILRGASPADLPVQTAENYLTVNLEAAAAINLTIPESVLRQAASISRPGDFDVQATATPSN
jgi:putative tryptophan/tyrosine transport system substrate-binding protein